MLKKILRVIFGIIGGIIGYQVVDLLHLTEEVFFSWHNLDVFFLSNQFFGVVVGGILGLILLPVVFEWLFQGLWELEGQLQRLPFQEVIAGAIGLSIGLLLGILIVLAFPLSQIPRFGAIIQVFLNLILGYFGLTLAVKKREELFSLFTKFPAGGKFSFGKKNRVGKGNYKILDTSVIIDGRIADICQSNFIEGVLVIPEFVLEELRHIADSPELLKRNRGRRGLDILNRIQKELAIKVEIVDQDFDDIKEVDSKLVKLAKMLDAKIITNDFNLNKVAKLQGVQVLNINELANAVKPIVLPGEEMEVKVIKEGKEQGQGVAYLDDGTMIVVDEGRKYIGKEIEVLVTSILQTAAGRMIFAKPKAAEQAL